MPPVLKNQDGSDRHIWQHAFQTARKNQLRQDKGYADKRIIETSAFEFSNLRFYGRSSSRAAQLNWGDGNSSEAKASEGKTYSNQTVDGLNKRIGITPTMFDAAGGTDTLRKNIKNYIKTVLTTMPPNSEEYAWASWLSEPSRLEALLVPEADGDLFKKIYKLDAAYPDDAAADINPVAADERSSFYKTIDHEKKRVIIGDNNRDDKYSHLISSGTTEKINEEEYEVYWSQETVTSDASKREGVKEGNRIKWTKGMNKKLDKTVSKGKSHAADLRKDLTKIFKPTSNGKNEAEKKASDYIATIESCLNFFFSKVISTRFFRLTSLMGLDFYGARGNSVVFNRNATDQDYGQTSAHPSRINRVITDSEWAHVNRMGYQQSHVNRVDNDTLISSAITMGAHRRR